MGTSPRKFLEIMIFPLRSMMNRAEATILPTAVCSQTGLGYATDAHESTPVCCPLFSVLSLLRVCLYSTHTLSTPPQLASATPCLDSSSSILPVRRETDQSARRKRVESHEPRDETRMMYSEGSIDHHAQMDGMGHANGGRGLEVGYWFEVCARDTAPTT